jgi:hypothetical protein
MTTRILLLGLLILGVGLPGCGDDDAVTQPSPTRSYALGFTPFPYAFTSKAIDYVYAKIGSEADLIAHHMDDGIPWEAALSGDPFHIAITDEWTQRKNNTPPGHDVFLAVTPISPFVVNFVVRDYDELWQALGSPDDIGRVWRDTGFYDEAGNSRPVRQLWMDELVK